MATAITFPAPLTLSSRRHRQESQASRVGRQAAVDRHPSSWVPVASSISPTSVVISCDDCIRQHSAACVDCVVTFVCGSFVDLEPDEARALALLQSVGLVPPLQHQRLSVSPNPS